MIVHGDKSAIPIETVRRAIKALKAQKVTVPISGGFIFFYPPFNEYGVPLHACYGVRHDAHYWAWVASWCARSSTRPMPAEESTAAQ